MSNSVRAAGDTMVNGQANRLTGAQSKSTPQRKRCGNEGHLSFQIGAKDLLGLIFKDIQKTRQGVTPLR